jgi:hypothetical protein
MIQRQVRRKKMTEKKKPLILMDEHVKYLYSQHAKSIIDRHKTIVLTEEIEENGTRYKVTHLGQCSDILLSIQAYSALVPSSYKYVEMFLSMVEEFAKKQGGLIKYEPPIVVPPGVKEFKIPSPDTGVFLFMAIGPAPEPKKKKG